MYFMFVDDSGNPHFTDKSQYYVISGIIIDEQSVDYVKEQLLEYKNIRFKNDYKDEEIHVHDIYKSYGNFKSLGLEEKYSLLTDLYNLIEKLPVTAISVGIDKNAFKLKHPTWNLFNAAWTFLIERFDNYINDNGYGLSKGLLRIDGSSRISQDETLRIVNQLRKHGSNFQKIKHILEEPLFVDSSLHEGIQLADASAYCTLRYLHGYQKFEPYWKIIHKKLRKNSQGIATGYGFKLFPNTRSETI